MKDFSFTEKIWLFVIITTTIIAYFLNLHLLPLHFEEPRRAMIALEMIFSGNWITPTQIGDYYYNKPPLFNWVLIGFVQLFQSQSELVFRLVTPISHFVMVYLTYVFTKKYIDQKNAIYAALLYLVCSHVFLHFSMHAEIDIFYSLITLLFFFLLFHFYQKKNYYALFISVYFLTALGVMTKGFPSLVFVGFSLLALFIYHNKFWKLLSLPHLVGISVLFLIVGGYFYIYAQYNSPLNYFYYLWSQSSERTPLEKPLSKVFLGLFSFPFDLLFLRFLPASLLVIFLFKKDIKNILKENSFVWFCALMFVGNIWVYWISPGTRPRYLFMFFPLLTIIFTYSYFKSDSEGSLRKKYFQYFIIFLLTVVILAAWGIPFVPELNFLTITYRWILSTGISLSVLIILILLFQNSKYQLFALISLMIVLRFVYNLLFIPGMKHEGEAISMYNHSVKIHEIVQDDGLYVHRTADGRVSLETIFYLERSRQEVITFQEEINTDDYFILFEGNVPNQPHEVFYNFNYQDHKLLLVKFKE